MNFVKNLINLNSVLKISKKSYSKVKHRQLLLKKCFKNWFEDKILNLLNSKKTHFLKKTFTKFSQKTIFEYY